MPPVQTGSIVGPLEVSGGWAGSVATRKERRRFSICKFPGGACPCLLSHGGKAEIGGGWPSFISNLGNHGCQGAWTPG